MKKYIWSHEPEWLGFSENDQQMTNKDNTSTPTNTNALSYYMSLNMRIRAQTAMGVPPEPVLTHINPTWPFRYVLKTLLLNG